MSHLSESTTSAVPRSSWNGAEDSSQDTSLSGSAENAETKFLHSSRRRPRSNALEQFAWAILAAVMAVLMVLAISCQCPIGGARSKQVRRGQSPEPQAEDKAKGEGLTLLPRTNVFAERQEGAGGPAVEFQPPLKRNKEKEEKHPKKPETFPQQQQEEEDQNENIALNTSGHSALAEGAGISDPSEGDYEEEDEDLEQSQILETALDMLEDSGLIYQEEPSLPDKAEAIANLVAEFQAYERELESNK